MEIEQRWLQPRQSVLRLAEETVVDEQVIARERYAPDAVPVVCYRFLLPAGLAPTGSQVDLEEQFRCVESFKLRKKTS